MDTYLLNSLSRSGSDFKISLISGSKSDLLTSSVTASCFSLIRPGLHNGADNQTLNSLCPKEVLV